jgi:hypothetical protein
MPGTGADVAWVPDTHTQGFQSPAELISPKRAIRAIKERYFYRHHKTSAMIAKAEAE